MAVLIMDWPRHRMPKLVDLCGYYGDNVVKKLWVLSGKRKETLPSGEKTYLKTSSMGGLTLERGTLPNLWLLGRG